MYGLWVVFLVDRRPGQGDHPQLPGLARRPGRQCRAARRARAAARDRRRRHRPVRRLRRSCSAVMHLLTRSAFRVAFEWRRLAAARRGRWAASRRPAICCCPPMGGRFLDPRGGVPGHPAGPATSPASPTARSSGRDEPAAPGRAPEAWCARVSRPPVSVVMPFAGDSGAAPRGASAPLLALATEPGDELILADNSGVGARRATG